ncbi:pyridoxamine 5'-phosphate oxidase family protein [Streptomyces sp. JH14]|uniref:hypothetical protein n=1 Tax=Streptomyces sp. JH14 TaxID=2793630 RepID=UPI0023F61CB7|nr:hypothetical protein [Streptomyces sp. JH14]MDF6040686.1 pyridoxamine 5'-phosphate oxidase family protein [Streptomyces sp. JH14]
MNPAAGQPAKARAQDGIVPRSLVQLEPGEALGLLGTVGMGRVIFSQHALSAARPVHHIADGEDIVVRLEDGGAPRRRSRTMRPAPSWPARPTPSTP